jgi:hypothetical protein
LKQLFSRGKNLKHKIKIENKFTNEKINAICSDNPPLKPSHFISLCILRELPQQKIPRASCGGGDPRLAIFLHSRVPMERFFDGMDQENSKPQGGKGQQIMMKIQKKKKNKKETMEERGKKRDFLWTWRFPYPCVLSISWECPGATALVRPTLRRTR